MNASKPLSRNLAFRYPGCTSESRIHLDTSFLTLSNPGASHPLTSTNLSLLCQTSRLAAGTGRKLRTDRGGRKIENEAGTFFILLYDVSPRYRLRRGRVGSQGGIMQ